MEIRTVLLVDSGVIGGRPEFWEYLSEFVRMHVSQGRTVRLAMLERSWVYSADLSGARWAEEYARQRSVLSSLGNAALVPPHSLADLMLLSAFLTLAEPVFLAGVGLVAVSHLASLVANGGVPLSGPPAGLACNLVLVDASGLMNPSAALATFHSAFGGLGGLPFASLHILQLEAPAGDAPSSEAFTSVLASSMASERIRAHHYRVPAERLLDALRLLCMALLSLELVHVRLGNPGLEPLLAWVHEAGACVPPVFERRAVVHYSWASAVAASRRLDCIPSHESTQWARLAWTDRTDVLWVEPYADPVLAVAHLLMSEDASVLSLRPENAAEGCPPTHALATVAGCLQLLTLPDAGCYWSVSQAWLHGAADEPEDPEVEVVHAGFSSAPLPARTAHEWWRVDPSSEEEAASDDGPLENEHEDDDEDDEDDDEEEENDPPNSKSKGTVDPKEGRGKGYDGGSSGWDEFGAYLWEECAERQLQHEEMQRSGFADGVKREVEVKREWGPRTTAAPPRTRIVSAQSVQRRMLDLRETALQELAVTAMRPGATGLADDGRNAALDWATQYFPFRHGETLLFDARQSPNLRALLLGLCDGFHRSHLDEHHAAALARLVQRLADAIDANDPAFFPDTPTAKKRAALYTRLSFEILLFARTYAHTPEHSQFLTLLEHLT